MEGWRGNYLGRKKRTEGQGKETTWKLPENGKGTLAGEGPGGGCWRGRKKLHRHGRDFVLGATGRVEMNRSDVTGDMDTDGRRMQGEY